MPAGRFGKLWFNRHLRAFDDRSGAWGSAAEAVCVAEGIVAGTLIGTTMGWRPVEAIAPGDLVMTFDGGLQLVRTVQRGAVTNGQTLPEPLWPVLVPAGALGNRAPLLLLAEQKVMIESDLAEDLYGDPFVLVPALALEGWRGIARVAPAAGRDLVQLGFEHEELVYCEGAVLLQCPAADESGLGALDIMLSRPAREGLKQLNLSQGREIVAVLRAEDFDAARKGAASERRAYAAFA